MDMSLALVSLENRNNFSLAQINLDLAIVKYPAPEEYTQIGRTISNKRRQSAENGPLHQTARKLGELFKDILPPTPTLLRTYGIRVSEITSQACADSQACKPQQGLFSAYAGIDSGSIWAAATSGAPAIAVHLLACMLARSFKPEQATAIWVELVDIHKETLAIAVEKDLFPEGQMMTRALSCLEFTRQELARWDASARAWLQSADEVKIYQHKQMQIIINDSAIPVNTEPTTYLSVKMAWTAALKALENLLQDIPQKIQDGAALLAISSWHLYPNMVVYRGANGKGIDVEAKDPLFPHTALLTLGLEAKHPGSVSWSMPLARLQYYGDAVCIAASTGPDNMRVTPQEFSYAVLGAAVCRWGPPNMITLVNETLHGLGRLFSCAKYLLTEVERTEFDFLEYLHRAATGIVACSDGVSSATAIQLFKLGARRSVGFLYSNNRTTKTIPPLFGVAEISTLLRLLRSVAEKKVAISHIPHKYERDVGYPRFLFLSRSENTGRLVLSGREGRWAVITDVELEDYLAGKGLPRQLINEVSLQRPYLPVLVPSESWRMLWNSLNEVQDKEHYVFDTEALNVFVQFATGGPDFYGGLESLCQGPHGYSCFNYLDNKLSVQEGEPILCCVYLPDGRRYPDHTLDAKAIDELLKPELVDNVKLRKHLREIWEREEAVKVVSACASVDKLLSGMPGSTVTTRILERPFHYRMFFPEPSSPSWSNISGLPRALALVCALDSGLYVDSAQLPGVFALATGNSIYVADALLQDPQRLPSSPLRRVPGNIGHAGISFLVRPATTKVSVPAEQNWRVINHAEFDGKVGNSFSNTSVHLSFTNFELGLRPIMDMSINTIDHAVKIIETAASAYDGSRWVADLDILHAVEGLSDFPDIMKPLHGCRQTCNDPGLPSFEIVQVSSPQTLPESQQRMKLCYESSSSIQKTMDKYNMPLPTVIDNWDEILDPPEASIIVVRSSGCWLARLALLAVCVEMGYFVVVARAEPCWPHILDSIHRAGFS